MADVRALLKAKRQEARVNHALAAYSANGQLRCTACGTAVKHASAWEGHLGSKAHRMNVARLKQEQAREASSQLKRKAEEEGEEDLRQDAHPPPKKAKFADGDAEVAQTNSARQAIQAGFPSDFFSDPSQAPLIGGSDSEEDDPSTAAGDVPVQTNHAQFDIDLEWLQFQQAVINAPDERETYEQATIFAEPELAPEVPEGFPAPAEQATEPVNTKLNEEALRKSKEREERELIMDRLLDEEAAQEEADMKVSVMKNRIEALKKKRDAAKLKSKSSAS